MDWTETDDSFDGIDLTGKPDFTYKRGDISYDFFRMTHPLDWDRKITILSQSGHFMNSDDLWTEGHPTFEELKESMEEFNFDED
jgi:hypothetical protein